MFAVIVPLEAVAEKHNTQVTPQVMKLIHCISNEMGRGELLAQLELKDRMHFTREYLDPAMAAGMIEMTIPDKPQSSKQKYRLTEKGRKALEKGSDNG